MDIHRGLQFFRNAIYSSLTPPGPGAGGRVRQAGDPATCAIVAVGLAVVALAATVIPAHRATRVNPIIAMRAE
jgi:ABC-type lipoprotein release transport system permease subunit